MYDELERVWKGAAIFESTYYPGTCPEGVRKTAIEVG
jgi:hypothetical protein